MRLASFSLIVALLLGNVGCGAFYYFTTFESLSPSGPGSIRVLRNMRGEGADYRFRIEVDSPHGTTVAYKNGLESSLGLMEAWWSDSGNEVGLLVCNALGPAVWIHYDLAEGKPLPAEDIEPAVLTALVRKYGLTQGQDVLEWACSNRGRAAFNALNEMPL